MEYEAVKPRQVIMSSLSLVLFGFHKEKANRERFSLKCLLVWLFQRGLIQSYAINFVLIFKLALVISLEK